MLTRIVVPLDGSAFGEQALPTALRLAERERAGVELVHVREPALLPSRTQGAPVLDAALDTALRADRADYLHAVAERTRRGTAVPVTAALLDGPVAPALADHLAARGSDLVVMTTHGRGGVSRAWLGSVAGELVRHTAVPVLLLPPDERDARRAAHRDAPGAFRRVLVPLDGSPAAEEALWHALAVTGTADVSYVLLHVTTPLLFLSDTAAATFPEQEAEAAAVAYLAELAGRLRERGVGVDTQMLRHAQPARAILDTAREGEADLVAMATHGWSGMKRLLMGSVADKVVRASAVPVLLYRPRVYVEPPFPGPEGVRSAARTG